MFGPQRSKWNMKLHCNSESYKEKGTMYNFLSGIRKSMLVKEVDTNSKIFFWNIVNASVMGGFYTSVWRGHIVPSCQSNTNYVGVAVKIFCGMIDTFSQLTLRRFPLILWVELIRLEGFGATTEVYWRKKNSSSRRQHQVQPESPAPQSCDPVPWNKSPYGWQTSR